MSARLTPASGVDTILWIIDATASTPKVVAVNDDIDSGTLDSLATGLATTTGTYYVVLDFFGIRGPTRDYEADISSQP